MSQFQPNLSDVIKCIDIFNEIQGTQWLLESINDAIECHRGDPRFCEHLIYLIGEYTAKMGNQVPRLEEAFKKVQAGQDIDKEWQDFINGNND
jgi:hypothetical protein